jgi:hypothetical protein
MRATASSRASMFGRSALEKQVSATTSFVTRTLLETSSSSSLWVGLRERFVKQQTREPGYFLTCP